MNINEKAALQDDNTFTISHNGNVLTLKLNPAARVVELLSASPPPPDSGPSTVKSSPYDDLLRGVSRPDAVYISNVIFDKGDLQRSLIPLQKFSKDMIIQCGVKPMVVVRIAGKDDAVPVFDLDDAKHTISADFDLDAHFVTIPEVLKKFQP